MATIRINTIPQEWRHEERDLDEVIPKAITLFHETSEYKEKVDVLTFLCHGLLQKLSLSSMEETLLCNVFSDLPLYVDKIFLEIEDVIQLENKLEQTSSTNKQEVLHDLLLVVLTILKCVESCVKHICATFQCIRIHQVHSLPVPVLLIVKSTFSHCQKSEASYGELFSSVSQDLSLLFRKSFELQKLLLELMCDKIEPLTSTSSERDLQNIISVYENLLDICDITERFDGNMIPGMWKSLMRLVMKNKEIIKNHLQSDRLVSQMCSALKEKLQNYDNVVNAKDRTEKDAIDEAMSTKLLKVLKFLIKLLMSFVQSFQDYLLSATFKHIIGLIFSIISVSYPRSTVQSSGSIPLDEVNSSLIIVVDPFLKILIQNKKFADLLTQIDEEILSKDYFSHCYTLANIVVLIPMCTEEMSLYWIKPENYSEDDPRVSIYEALLDSCDACFLEMSLPLQLPGTMCDGKAQRMVSFYEYVASRLAASISAIPSQHFHIVEKVLLRSVFGHSIISSSIATDVWCFIARWMTADLCYSHVKLFLHWFSTVSWKSDIEKNRMSLLVRRLLPLVAQEHQELFVQEYPPDCLENIHIWSVVPVHKMIDSIRMQASRTIVQLSMERLQLWLDKNLSQLELEKYLHCLQNLVTHSVILDSLPPDLKSKLILATTRLFDEFMDVSKEISEFCWLSVLDILKSILPLMQSQHFAKILYSIANAVDLFHGEINMNLYFARLMAECGKLTFPIGVNESTLISKIFRTLITSNQWLVHNEVFAALRRFAEVTPYTPVLEECVPDEMKEAFQKFICTIPYGSQEGEDQHALVLNELREQAKIVRKNEVQICASSGAPAPSNAVDKAFDKRKREGTYCESDAKRSKVIESDQFSNEDEEMLTSSVEALSKHLLALQEIHSRCSQLPPEVWEKLKSIKSLLDTLVKSN